MFPNRRLFKEKHKIKLSRAQLDEINVFKKKLESKEYTLEEIKCECCKINDSIILSEYDRFGIPYKSNFCKNCGLVYTSPRLDQDSIIKFYNNQYRKIYINTNQQDPLNFFLNNQIKRGEKIYALIEQNFKLNKPLNVLEVGCGMGGILQAFNQKKHRVKGVDYGSDYINYGKKNYLNLFVGGIFDVQGEFYVIIYSHVFEHILDLKKELIEIKKHLKKEGVLYIQVPGILNLKKYRFDLNRYFQNAHNYNFSLNSLNNILTLNGFEMIYGDETVEALFRVSNNTKSLINDFDRINSEIKKLAYKRIGYIFSPEGFRIYLVEILKQLRLYTILRRIFKGH